MAYKSSVSNDGFEEFLKKNGYADSMLQASKYTNSSILDSISKLEEQKKVAMESADELARKAYIKYVNAKSALPEQLSNAGYNGGLADSFKVSLENEYQNAYNNIIKDRYNTLNDIESQKNSLQIKADNEIAERVYKLYSDAASSYSDSIEKEKEREFDEYLTNLKADNSIKELNLKNKFDRQNEIYSLALKIGDMSKLKELGLDTSYYEQTLANEKYSESLKNALAAAEYGDYSLLEGLGIDPFSSNISSDQIPSSAPETYEALTRGMKVAEKMAEYGSYSLLSKLTGVDESVLKRMYETKAVVSSDETKEPAPSLDLKVPSVEGFAEAIRLFMKGNTREEVLKVIRAAYPTYTYDEVFALWRTTCIDEFGFFPAQKYNGPARTFKEEEKKLTLDDLKPHVILNSLFGDRD